jgi:hypothetical protein
MGNPPRETPTSTADRCPYAFGCELQRPLGQCPESSAFGLEWDLLIDLDEAAIWIAKVEAAHTPVGTVVGKVEERCTSAIECLVRCVNIRDRDDHGGAAEGQAP